RRGLFDRARGQRRRHAVAGDDVMTARLGRIGPMWRSASRFFRAPASLRRLGVLVVRESRATLRDPFTLTILVVVPLGALLVFSLVLSTEVRGIGLGVVDAAGSPTARRVLADLAAPGTFELRRYPDRAALDDALIGGEIGVAIVLPPDLERDGEQTRPEIQVLYDGTEVVLAGNSEAALGAIVAASLVEQAGPRAV